MHFFSLLPALLMFVGVNAGVLEDHGYTLHKFTDGTCTITADYYGGGNRLVNKFAIDKDNGVITIHQALNALEIKRRDQMSLPEILEAVCSEYDLVPDSINSVVMDAYKNDHLIHALAYYRKLRPIADNKYVTASITPAMSGEWHRFAAFWLYADIESMLTDTSVNEIRVQEKGGERCLLTFVIAQ